jgi:hypothetical protein
MLQVQILRQPKILLYQVGMVFMTQMASGLSWVIKGITCKIYQRPTLMLLAIFKII